MGRIIAGEQVWSTADLDTVVMARKEKKKMAGTHCGTSILVSGLDRNGRVFCSCVYTSVAQAQILCTSVAQAQTQKAHKRFNLCHKLRRMRRYIVWHTSP